MNFACGARLMYYNSVPLSSMYLPYLSPMSHNNTIVPRTASAPIQVPGKPSTTGRIEVKPTKRVVLLLHADHPRSRLR